MLKPIQPSFATSKTYMLERRGLDRFMSAGEGPSQLAVRELPRPSALQRRGLQRLEPGGDGQHATQAGGGRGGDGPGERATGAPVDQAQRLKVEDK